MEFLAEIYIIIEGILDSSMIPMQKGMWKVASGIFNNSFFEWGLTGIFLYLSFKILTRQIKEDAIVNSIIWALLITALVNIIMYDKQMYNLTLEILNLPRDTLSVAISDFVSNINKEANTENLIKNISISIGGASSKIIDEAGLLSGGSAYLLAGLLWLSGFFLILVMIFMSLISSFLAEFVLIFLPFVLVFVIFRKTENIFFAWVKVYISLSLYEPLCSLFGIVTQKGAEYVISITNNANSLDFSTISGLVLLQVVIGLCLFKIPNLINQVISSSNEGSSFSGAVGTASAAGAVSGAGVGLIMNIRKMGGMIPTSFGDKGSFKRK